MIGRKKGKLFGTRIDPNCAYCAHGCSGEEGASCRMECRPKEDGSCRFFAYDPLKRTPFRLPPLKPHRAEEFKL